jgi:hypothetical protein
MRNPLKGIAGSCPAVMFRKSIYVLDADKKRCT